MKIFFFDHPQLTLHLNLKNISLKTNSNWTILALKALNFARLTAITKTNLTAKINWNTLNIFEISWKKAFDVLGRKILGKNAYVIEKV